MATMRLLARAAAASVFAFFVAACASDGPNADECAPGDFVRVTLADGGAGYMQCASDGGGYAPYDGDPNVPADAGDLDAGACDLTEGAHLGVFMCAGCTDDTQCASGLVCFSFANKGGGRCTRVCTSNADCPAPANGCGNNGHCRPQ
jgi:hypothetical protein